MAKCSPSILGANRTSREKGVISSEIAPFFLGPRTNSYGLSYYRVGKGLPRS